MSFVVSEVAKSASNKPRPVPKAGTQAMRVLQVVDLGIQARKPFQGTERKPVRQVMLTFELCNDKMEYNGEEVPLRISTRALTLSADPKGNLFKMMNGIDPTNKLKGDLDLYPNTAVLGTIVHTEDGDKTYANIAGVMPVPDGFPVPPLHDKPCVFNFDNPTLESYSLLPNWIHKKIAEATNFEGSKVEAIAKQFEATKEATPAEAPAEAPKPAKATKKPSGDAPF